MAREELEAAVERACRHVGYLNAGTFEFLLGPDGRPCFIEVNCRLQVEHPVSELTTGHRHRPRAGPDRRRRAAGAAGRAPRRGHAIEIRINAEDPARDFAPAPGAITRFRPPLGPGVRVDTAVVRRPSIPPYYDSLDRQGDRLGRRRGTARSRAAMRALQSSRSKGSRRRASSRSTSSAREVRERRVLDELPCRDGGQAPVALRRVSCRRGRRGGGR